MIDSEQPLTLADLQNGLALELDFVGNDWGGPSNELTVTLKLGDTVLCSSRAYIEPAGYAREESPF